MISSNTGGDTHNKFKCIYLKLQKICKEYYFILFSVEDYLVCSMDIPSKEFKKLELTLLSLQCLYYEGY